MIHGSSPLNSLATPAMFQFAGRHYLVHRFQQAWFEAVMHTECSIHDLLATSFSVTCASINNLKGECQSPANLNSASGFPPPNR